MIDENNYNRDLQTSKAHWRAKRRTPAYSWALLKWLIL